MPNQPSPTPIESLTDEQADALVASLTRAGFDATFFTVPLPHILVYSGGGAYVRFPAYVDWHQYANVGIFLDACIKLGLAPNVIYPDEGAEWTTPKLTGRHKDKFSITRGDSSRLWSLDVPRCEKTQLRKNIPLLDQLAHVLIAYGEHLLSSKEKYVDPKDVPVSAWGPYTGLNYRDIVLYCDGLGDTITRIGQDDFDRFMNHALSFAPTTFPGYYAFDEGTTPSFVTQIAMPQEDGTLLVVEDNKLETMPTPGNPEKRVYDPKVITHSFMYDTVSGDKKSFIVRHIDNTGFIWLESTVPGKILDSDLNQEWAKDMHNASLKAHNEQHPDKPQMPWDRFSIDRQYSRYDYVKDAKNEFWYSELSCGAWQWKPLGNEDRRPDLQRVWKASREK